MARIAGIEIPNNKRIEIGLTYIFGVGLSTSKKILKNAKIDSNTLVSKLSPVEIETIRREIAKYRIEGDLRTEINQNIKRLKEIGTYRGHRHSRSLPVRGQRTKTNARTKRGKKVTVGSGRKKAAEKT
ncbi:MAG: small subunit ribosomal protein S13 [Candidatus Berkelbacteria bacterium Athens1014_28]|uniref:Small ribosomal subunit protein uS13 n=1 Tax=Candidatus Berkelbacteria bacterium Athens1014_28 TaxID=2017145 RepID=A0A554LR04_9BACT|nr:MAG: small subunit ribosomal protein S13 [Candidatus Berkelbacteria bacterium Athens1014_28]